LEDDGFVRRTGRSQDRQAEVRCVRVVGEFGFDTLALLTA